MCYVMLLERSCWTGHTARTPGVQHKQGLSRGPANMAQYRLNVQHSLHHFHLSLSLWRDTQRQAVSLSLANGNLNISIIQSPPILSHGTPQKIFAFLITLAENIYRVLFTQQVCL